MSGESERPPVDPLREALRWFLDNNPNATARDLIDGVRTLLDDPALASPAAPRPEGPDVYGAVIVPDGLYPAEERDIAALRAALAPAAPRPEGLECPECGRSVTHVRGCWVARLSDTGDTEEDRS